MVVVHSTMQYSSTRSSAAAQLHACPSRCRASAVLEAAPGAESCAPHRSPRRASGCKDSIGLKRHAQAGSTAAKGCGEVVGRGRAGISSSGRVEGGTRPGAAERACRQSDDLLLAQASVYRPAGAVTEEEAGRSAPVLPPQADHYALLDSRPLSPSTGSASEQTGPEASTHTVYIGCCGTRALARQMGARAWKRLLRDAAIAASARLSRSRRPARSTRL